MTAASTFWGLRGGIRLLENMHDLGPVSAVAVMVEQLFVCRVFAALSEHEHEGVCSLPCDDVFQFAIEPFRKAFA